ncbi:MAG: anhydro-N-acetylmuramic acid kinase [Yoonia sp.]|uniref:anhydro-N-acetylmuramic acid kinase n=1 Tax=Yoonia sp. TaxID=2212373 RepID=UPI0032636176
MLKSGPIRSVGAMSGTSLDGVDAAEIVTDGVTISEFGPVAYRAYTDAERSVLKAALGKWQEDDVDAVAELIETTHAQVLHDFQNAELVGFHGQTLAHDPHGRGTHQCGDGAVLAEVLDKPVVWDFRSADVRLGGEGAPLAPFFHFALAQYIKAAEPLVFLNLGGVGNLTWIDPAVKEPHVGGALLAFDTGPANAPLNDLMQSRRGEACDADGKLAQSGVVDESIIEQFLNHPYFYKIPPKSLDRDDFAELTAKVVDLSDADAAATLTAAAAMSVAHSISHCPAPPKRVLVTGGGRRNPTLMAMLAASLDCAVIPVEDVGLDGDMLEAQAFAYLAVRVARGLPTSCQNTTGVKAAVSGGTLSRPSSFG